MTFDVAIPAVKHLMCAIMMLVGSEPDFDCEVIPSTTAVTFPIMDKCEWGAKPPISPPERLQEVPVPFVILHDTPTFGYCNSTKECMEVMREIQTNHQDDLGWNDIDCSFCIGNDGLTMQGRGWDSSGTDAPGYNERSIGICLIGDYSSIVPDDGMLNATKELINYGIAIGKISAEYILLGHRQVRNNDCPGYALFNEIQQWSHWKSLENQNQPFPTIVFQGDDERIDKSETLSYSISDHMTTAASLDIISSSEMGTEHPESSPESEDEELPLPTESSQGADERIDMSETVSYSILDHMTTTASSDILSSSDIGTEPPDTSAESEDKELPLPTETSQDDVLAWTEEEIGDEREVVHSTITPSFPIISRSEWGAKPSKSRGKQMLEMPVPIVIIHDTIIPKSCNSTIECKLTMQEIQENHQHDHNSDDIEFSFCIGYDGLIMEGRGWDLITETAPAYHGRNIEIALIGDFDKDIPNDGMVNAVQELINYGISIGKISANYTLLAHRQLIVSKCPGDALYNLIQYWPHWGHPEVGIMLDEGEKEVIHTTTAPSFPIISRREWGAKPPKSPGMQMQMQPAPFVIIHDTRIPKSCDSMNDCKEKMRWIQNNHQDDHNYNDIDFSFCIGFDGMIMEARGWDLVTENRHKYHGGNIEIALLGDFNINLPDDNMIHATQRLINYGISIGKISANYILLGHRQLVESSNCPGDALFNLMMSWPHWAQLNGNLTVGIKLDEGEKEVIHTTTAPSFPIMSRSEWGAKSPKSPIEIIQEVPVPFVILHDTYIPKSCHSTNECKETMREIQGNHQDDRGLQDIAFSFCFGHNGLTMEGRGWDLSIEDLPGYHEKSIGIALIGDYRTDLPDDGMIKAVQGLINYGISIGKISANYTLLAHRQVKESSNCPGDVLFNLMKSWPHWGNP